ncbi:MAG: hypothetical protein LBS39_02740 [Campylobacteraceae bacterium]|nr:hypothetical protein [Campylobacteraceae bacterium]
MDCHTASGKFMIEIGALFPCRQDFKTSEAFLCKQNVFPCEALSAC